MPDSGKDHIFLDPKKFSNATPYDYTKSVRKKKEDVPAQHVRFIKLQ